MQLSLCSFLQTCIAIAGLAIGILASGKAIAGAPAQVSDRMKPMQVRIVRDARPGCAPNCLEWIAADGKIMPETRILFERVFRSLGARRLPVFIDSIGGSVPDAMAIGRMIRARHLDVVVTRTLSDVCTGPACPTHAAPGTATPQQIGAICASACPLIFAAGSKRVAAFGTHLGVHQIISTGTRIWKRRTFRDLTRMVDGVKILINRSIIDERVVRTEHYTNAAPKAVYAKVEAYLAEMGIKPEIMPLMLATPASSMHWMSRDEMQSTSLVTDEGYALAEAPPVAPKDNVAHLATSAPEEAMIVDPPGDAPRQKITIGRVTWTLDRQPDVPAADARLVLGADIAVPQAQTSLDLQIAPDGADGALRIDVTFWTPNHTLRKIMRLSPLQVRSETPLLVTPLDGAVSSSMTGTFTMALKREVAGMPVTTLLMDRRWIVVPVFTEELRAVDIRFEHGIFGTPLMARAIASWPRGAKVATAPVGTAGKEEGPKP